MADSNRGEQKVAIYVDEEDEVWLWFDYFVLGCIESVVWFWFVFGWLSMAWSSWTSGIRDDSIHILQTWSYHIDILKEPGEFGYEPIFPEEVHDRLIDTILNDPFRVKAALVSISSLGACRCCDLHRRCRSWAEGPREPTAWSPRPFCGLWIQSVSYFCFSRFVGWSSSTKLWIIISTNGQRSLSITIWQSTVFHNHMTLSRFDCCDSHSVIESYNKGLTISWLLRSNPSPSSSESQSNASESESSEFSEPQS